METAGAGDNAAVSRDGLRTVPAAVNDYELQCVAFLQGDMEAAYHLGWLRFSGRDVPADNARAAGWFRMAAQHGDLHSQRILDELLPGTLPADDTGCPARRGKPDRATIEAWINVLAPGYGLDADLLHAVVEVESRFNPRARSPKNARGLMQLLPATARRFEVDDIWDPFENLRGGMAYLRWLLDHYDGDLDLSLAAYNAGEQVVNRYGGIPPYRETRDYVKNVNHLYNRAVQ
jgi:TPR repeat protein